MEMDAGFSKKKSILFGKAIVFIIQAASYHCHTKAARHTCLSKSRTLEVPTQARQLNVLGNNTDDSATK